MRRPWPVTLSLLRESGLESSYSPVTKQISVLIECAADEELLDAWRQPAASVSRPIWLPVAFIALLCIGYFSLWPVIADRNQDSDVGVSASQQSLSCHDSMLRNLAAASGAIQAITPQDFGEILRDNLPTAESISEFRVLIELGGVAQANFVLARNDCASFNLKITMGLVGDLWVKTKITRQPSD